MVSFHLVQIKELSLNENNTALVVFNGRIMVDLTFMLHYHKINACRESLVGSSPISGLNPEVKGLPGLLGEPATQLDVTRDFVDGEEIGRRGQQVITDLCVQTGVSVPSLTEKKEKKTGTLIDGQKNMRYRFSIANNYEV